MTAAELSKRTGISKSSISHYLKGDWKGKQDVIYKIARETDCDEAWLMGADVPMERTTHARLQDFFLEAVKYSETDAAEYKKLHMEIDKRPCLRQILILCADKTDEQLERIAQMIPLIK
jgi:transcriptional regulator with XRE-family HTH domain